MTNDSDRLEGLTDLIKKMLLRLLKNKNFNFLFDTRDKLCYNKLYNQFIKNANEFLLHPDLVYPIIYEMSSTLMSFNLKTVKILISFKPSVFAPFGGKKPQQGKTQKV